MPKALVRIDGRSFLDHVVSACRNGGCGIVIVVAAPGARQVAEDARALGADLAVNPDPDRGMLSSVETGLRALLPERPDLAAVLVFPVDHPRVRARTVAALVAAGGRDAAPAVVRPMFQGAPGHPILVRADIARAILGDRDATTLRDALARAGAAAVDVEVDDAGVAKNMNDPADVE